MTAEEFEKIKTTGVGEIVVTGKNVLKGYVNGVGDKENKFKVDGKVYHRTGDLGYMDQYGRLWLEGRKKSPFFNVEAALHTRTELGKTAIVKLNDKIYLVLEEKDQIDPKVLDQIEFVKIESIIYVKKIPVDKRHSSKVDYNALYKIVTKKV
jgi:acyl-coenzyme A synthetase/AMP-(fatty) acid ligase